MKYIKKIPSVDEDLSERLILEGWTRIKEPSKLWVASLLSVPFMLINGVISMIIAFYLYAPIKEFLISNQGFSFTLTINLSTLMYIAIILVFIAIHEFIHALFIPNALKSDEVYWGMKIFYAFIYTTERIKRGRYLIISIMPFVLLSIILPFIFHALELLNGFTIFLCVINAMGSSVDCLNICLVAAQVPRGAYVLCNGTQTYFK